MRTLQENYDDLLADQIPYFVYNFDGSLEDFQKQYPVLHIFSGSFHPLHDMHRLIYRSMKKCAEHIYAFPQFVYEICVCPRGKDCLTLEELKERLEQFDKSELVIVTNCTYFVAKTGALDKHNVSFHIGYDTATRLMGDDSFYGTQGIRAMFYVYSRDGISIEQLDRVPSNFRIGVYDGEYENGVSSTKIREETHTSP